MQIHYITRKEPIWSDPDIRIEDNFDSLFEMFRNTEEIGADTENNSLHPINAMPLLAQFSDGKESWVVDVTTCSTSFLQGLEGLDKHFTSKEFLMHNAQYDYMIFKYHYGLALRRLKDTMINEQVLGRGSGRSANLEETHIRRLHIPLPVPKNTREDFTLMKYNPVFLRDHIYYSGYDPICLFPIQAAQKPLIEQYKLEKRIYDIAYPCISILGDMCLNGTTLDKEKWLSLLDENKKEQFHIELKLDEIVKEFSKDNLKIKGGLYTNKRKKAEIIQQGLFDDPIVNLNLNKHNIAYNSPSQLAKLFKKLGEPLPEKPADEQTDWSNKKMVISFGEEVLEQYKIKFRNSRMIPFINLLLKHKEYEKEINSFGEIFLKDVLKDGKKNKLKRGYWNRITKKIHTIYKQEFTKNGRLASGEGKKKQGELGIGFYNSQQVPKKNKFRNCFTLSTEEIADGWFRSTRDLSGAELVILASHSGDKKLIKLIKEGADLHSHLSSAIYTKIFKYILANVLEDRQIEEISHLLKVNRTQYDYEYEWTENGTKKTRPWTLDEIKTIQDKRLADVLESKGTIVVNKKLFPDLRNPVKNVVYGINYGAGEEKVSETLNFAPYYAKLAMQAMREELPDAFAYLDRMSRFGVKYGYIVFNERTHSRHWFKAWLDAQAYGRELSKKAKGAIERACKNYAISGTQADMIKESMANVDTFRLNSNVEFKWIFQVHDELVFDHKHNTIEEAKAYAKGIDKIITDTCNLYLKDIEMKVEGDTGYNWNK
jgi:DNA polymerase I-like protein with 3'-5' exonuclease and polymerase domains